MLNSTIFYKTNMGGISSIHKVDLPISRQIYGYKTRRDRITV